MKIMIAASTLTNPFQPLLNAPPIVCSFSGSGSSTTVASGSGLMLSCTRNVASETRSPSSALHRLVLLDQRLALGQLALQTQDLAEIGRCLEELANTVEAGLRGDQPGVDVDHLTGYVFGALRCGAPYTDRVEVGDRVLDVRGRQLDDERRARRPIVGDVDRAFVDLSAVASCQRDDIVDPPGDVVDFHAVAHVDREVGVLRDHVRQIDDWSARALFSRCFTVGGTRHLACVSADRRRVDLRRFGDVDVGFRCRRFVVVAGTASRCAEDDSYEGGGDPDPSVSCVHVCHARST